MHLLEKKLLESWPPAQWRDVTVVVAVSGGADSVALLRGLLAIQTQGEGNFLVAHFNHRLRGAESDEDAEFVKRLCQSLGVELRLGESEADLAESTDHDGVEAAARDARYAFLKAEAHRAGARYLVTGHTADDQAETILHRILRGTGIAGLAGIPRTRVLSEAVTIVRPLLTVRRATVVEYLRTLQQTFCEDSSNQDSQFTRNRIRHQLLPQLAAEYNPQIAETLLRLGALAGQAQMVVDAVVADLLPRAVRNRLPHVVEIDCVALAGQPEHVVREFFVALWKNQKWPAQDMSFERWDSLASLASNKDSTSGNLITKGTAISFPGEVMAKRVGDFLRVDATRGQQDMGSS